MLNEWAYNIQKWVTVTIIALLFGTINVMWQIHKGEMARPFFSLMFSIAAAILSVFAVEGLFNLEPDKEERVVRFACAFCALTANNIFKIINDVTENPKKYIDIWRGKK